VLANKFNSQIRMDQSLYERVKVIASKELRSLNAQIEYFILKGVEQYESEHDSTHPESE
jgi:hypothetical protein